MFTQFIVKSGIDKVSALFPEDYEIGAGHVVLISGFDVSRGFLTSEMSPPEGPKSLTLKISINFYNTRIDKGNNVIQVHVLRPNKRLIKGYYLNEKKMAPQFLQGQVV